MESETRSLVDWIEGAGGSVHDALELRGSGSHRGVFAARAIPKGQLLIRLPYRLALSGEEMPKVYHGDSIKQDKMASPWLRTVAAFYQARHPNSASWRPYLESLPKEYESLLHWTDQEVNSYLSGTALGEVVCSDRQQNALETCYTSSVRPYLKHLQLLPLQDQSREEEEEGFHLACMCISTRGFHLRVSEEEDEEVGENSSAASFSGPFLLPFIDLLNHGDGASKCTTLQRRDDNKDDKSFYMIAERHVKENEEILHSYGDDDVTSGQLLRTFGFVPANWCERMVNSEATGLMDLELTPAVMSKASIVRACHSVIHSEYPEELRNYMKANHMEADEVWDLCSQERDLGLVPENLLVNATSPLSDELVTLCCLLLLPTDAYREFYSDSPVLLEKPILEDYFLGKLVGRAILAAISEKSKGYLPVTISGETDASPPSDKQLLSCLLEKGTSVSATERRAMYGLTVRLEEKACLELLRSEVLELLDFLDDDVKFVHPQASTGEATIV